VGLVPVEATAAEASLMGHAPSDDALRQAAALAAAAGQPNGDQRGSEAYKRSMVRTLTMRALRAALTRAKGGEA